MNKSELDFIKKKGRWPIKLSDFYKHYFFMLFPIGIIVINILEAVSGYKNDISELKIISLCFLTFGLLLTILTMKRLVQNQIFLSYSIEGLTLDEIKTALNSINLHNTTIYRQGYVQTMMNISRFSWGELVTIIPDNDRFLINSRPRQPITVLKDKKNIKKIVNAISDHRSKMDKFI